ncbi:hypothetical protein WMF31_40205 [Sorangium sp. So ce1036]|uniref:hypothetical protein n=1 Tax=Sorangium sp. So ce1036 TaxID=3133328 RepID=UPI003F080AA9
MDTAAFLAEIEPLKNDDRVRRVVSLGRDAAAGDAGARAILAALSVSAQPYERLLALLGVHGTGDGARVVAALSDPSRTVRRRAARMVPRFCDDAQALAALDAIVGRRLLRRTVAALARRKRVAVVDAFLAARMKQGRDPTIVDLLPFGSEPLVSAHLRDIDEAGGPSCLDRLADRHPAVTGRWFQASIERSRALDVRQRYRLASLLAPLARRAPDAALRLVQSLFQLGEEPSSLSGALRVLVRARPRGTFDLLKARHEGGRPARPPGAFEVARFDKVAPALGAERLDYLVRHAWAALGDGKRGVRWFLRLAADDRQAVLRAFLAGERGGFGAFLFRHVTAGSPGEIAARERAFERWSCAARGSDGTIKPEVLDFLPRDLREREARRHLDDCPALTTRPDRRMAYARLLGFAEARAALAPFLGHPEGEERAKAQRLLVATVLHDRGALAEALKNVRGRKFEQDPVRRAMIEALAALPVARFGPEHLEDVGQVVQDALDAADLSPATAAAVERLVVRLFRVDGAWGARWLAKLLSVRGAIATLGLGEGLTREEAARLAPALAQLVDLWCTKERAAAVIWLAQSLGERLAAVPPVLGALERLARELPFAGVAARALALLRAHDRPRLARLVPELLREDRSFVLIDTVARLVSLRRQDLLDPLLLAGAAAPRGVPAGALGAARPLRPAASRGGRPRGAGRAEGGRAGDASVSRARGAPARLEGALGGARRARRAGPPAPRRDGRRHRRRAGLRASGAPRGAAAREPRSAAAPARARGARAGGGAEERVVEGAARAARGVPAGSVARGGRAGVVRRAAVSGAGAAPRHAARAGIPVRNSADPATPASHT